MHIACNHCLLDSLIDRTFVQWQKLLSYPRFHEKLYMVGYQILHDVPEIILWVANRFFAPFFPNSMSLTRHLQLGLEHRLD